ncbi:hypothetical protein K443DRAFT_671149 [Laccaria amethystina LaAM-08-1]|uniref:Uncharacterized protein n=1 Tax=Laccaria amethystina LaAM-08-1 TaxID=1095629 RepID=A0A0C9YHJ3_9AGAR|nr:hypothetical protein K443DRAFT_671149 [Laccaria amethystina LaAM-08-1]
MSQMLYHVVFPARSTLPTPSNPRFQREHMKAYQNLVFYLHVACISQPLSISFETFPERRYCLLAGVTT